MKVSIGGREIDSETGPVFLIAEIGGNHNGDYATAEKLVRAAAAAGADAVKFQIYRAERLVRPDLPAMAHVRSRWAKQIDRFKFLELQPDQYRALARLSKELGILFMASAFDESCTDLVDELSPAFKVASGDLTHLPMLRRLARKGKPVILSSGMAEEPEIAAALKALAGAPVILLHCVSRYPTPDAEANLLAIPYLKERFGLPTGYSDHTLGSAVCLSSAALGAVVIEKHFTLDKTQEFGDHKLSCEPDELAALVRDLKRVRAALGVRGKPIGEGERAMRHAMRRSLVASRDIPAGARIEADALDCLRPSDGISPLEVDAVVGRTARRPIKAGQPLAWEDVAR